MEAVPSQKVLPLFLPFPEEEYRQLAEKRRLEHPVATSNEKALFLALTAFTIRGEKLPSRANDAMVAFALGILDATCPHDMNDVDAKDLHRSIWAAIRYGFANSKRSWSPWMRENIESLFFATSDSDGIHEHGMTNDFEELWGSENVSDFPAKRVARLRRDVEDRGLKWMQALPTAEDVEQLNLLAVYIRPRLIECCVRLAH